MKVRPRQVDAETFRDFREYLEKDLLLRNPRERWHVPRRAWNRAIASVSDQYPQVPNDEAPGWRGLFWGALAVTLCDEITAYRKFKLHDDPFAEKDAAGSRWFETERKRLKSITVDGYISRIRQLASRLIEGGVPVSQLANLSALIDVKTVKKGLLILAADRVKDGRFTDEARPALHATMSSVLSVAGFLGVNVDHLDKLKSIAKQVRHRPTGMCDRNKLRLGPFNDPEVMRRFVDFP